MRAIRGDSGEAADDGSGVLSPLLPENPAEPPRAITHPERGLIETVWITLKGAVPSLVVNGILFAGPSWMRFPDVVFGLVFVGTGLVWLGLELYWLDVDVRRYLRSVSRRIPVPKLR